MIRWCAYCQRYLGEAAPLDSALITHGMCPACEARMSAGEALIADTEGIRDLMRRIFDCAESGDDTAIPALLAEASARRIPPATVLVALLQPALYRAGEEWHDGAMSVATEHRLTQWCERFFAHLPPRKPRVSTLDLLILLAPGNIHTVGPRFAAEMLCAHGWVAEAVAPELSVADMVAEIERRRPRFVGLSCSEEASLRAVDALVLELDARIAPDWPRRFLIGGLAVRHGAAPWVSAAGATVCPTVEDVERALGPSAPAPRADPTP